MAKKLHTLKEKLAKAQEICDLYATGKYTIADVCENVGITDRTWNLWCKDISDISDLYKNAKNQCDINTRSELKEKALTALHLLLSEREVEEVTEITKKTALGNPYQERKVTKKKIQPNPTIVIFTLTNTDPENFKHKSEIALGSIPGVTKEEQQDVLRELKDGIPKPQQS